MNKFVRFSMVAAVAALAGCSQLDNRHVMHISVAAAVAYLVTGDALTAVTLSLLEPTVQAVAFFFHEKAWAKRTATAEATTGDDAAPQPA